MTAKARGCESLSGSSRNDWGTPLSVRMKSSAVSENTVSPTLVFTSAGTSTTFECTVRGGACEAGCLSEPSADGSADCAPTTAVQENPSKSTPTRTAFDRLDMPCETRNIIDLMLLEAVQSCWFREQTSSYGHPARIDPILIGVRIHVLRVSR